MRSSPQRPMITDMSMSKFSLSVRVGAAKLGAGRCDTVVAQGKESRVRRETWKGWGCVWCGVAWCTSNAALASSVEKVIRRLHATRQEVFRLRQRDHVRDTADGLHKVCLGERAVRLPIQQVVNNTNAAPAEVCARWWWWWCVRGDQPWRRPQHGGDGCMYQNAMRASRLVNRWSMMASFLSMATNSSRYM